MSIVEIIAQQITGNHSSIPAEHAIETAKDIVSALKLNGLLDARAAKAEVKASDLPAAEVEDGKFAFEVIGDLPESGLSKFGRKIPVIRQQFIEFAKAHRGQWIKYPATAEDPYTKPSDFASRATKGIGGFGPGFVGAVRDHVVFICFEGEAQE